MSIKQENLTDTHFVLPIGYEIPWSETCAAINKILKKSKDNSHAFSNILIISAIMFRSGAPVPTEASFTEMASQAFRYISSGVTTRDLSSPKS